MREATTLFLLTRQLPFRFNKHYSTLVNCYFKFGSRYSEALPAGAMQKRRLSQQELESYLWGAANILRGLVDSCGNKKGRTSNRTGWDGDPDLLAARPVVKHLLTRVKEVNDWKYSTYVLFRQRWAGR